MSLTQDTTASIATYTVTGLTCGKCVAKVERALSPLAKAATVTLNPPRVLLVAPEASLEQMNTMLALVGDYALRPTVAGAPAETGTVTAPAPSWIASYYPLLLIVTFVALGSFAHATHWHDWMQNFMAGFFLVFAFFKILNLSGFATAYARYDLIAARWTPWGFIYPFAELALGFIYLFGHAGPRTHMATLILMTVGALGVINALGQKKELNCACLGSTLNLPLSSVALVEDLGMAAMAVAMLL